MITAVIATVFVVAYVVGAAALLSMRRADLAAEPLEDAVERGDWGQM